MRSLTTNVPVVIGILVAFVAINLIAVKLYHKPQKNMEVYAVGERKMPWFLVCFTYMGGWYVGATYTGWVGNSVDIGLFAQYLCIYSLSSLIFLYLLARPVWSWGKYYSLETPSEFMGIRYNSIGFQRFYSVFMLIVDGSWLIIEVVTLAYICNVATNGVISMTLGIVLGGLVVAVYTTIGGVNATAISSVVQGLSFVVVGSILFIYLQYKTYGGFVPLYEMISAHKPELLYLPKENGIEMLWITSIVTGTLGALCWPTGFQRLYLASSPRECKKTLYVAPICALVVVFLILVPAMGASLLEGHPADSQMTEFWIANQYSGAVALGLVTVFAGAAAMSTMAAVANCISIPFAKDILSLIWKKTSIVTLSKWTTFIVCLVAMFIATMDIPQLNFFAIMLYGFVCQCIVPIIGGVFWKKGNKIGASLGIAIGCICAVIQTFWPAAFSWSALGGVLIGIILNTVVFVICGFVLGKQDHVDEMFEVIKLYDNDGYYYPEVIPELAAKCTHESY